MRRQPWRLHSVCEFGTQGTALEAVVPCHLGPNMHDGTRRIQPEDDGEEVSPVANDRSTMSAGIAQKANVQPVCNGVVQKRGEYYTGDAFWR